MSERYVIRPDSQGYSVLDLVTGQAAEIAKTPQRGLSKEDAEHVARLFNAQPAEATST